MRSVILAGGVLLIAACASTPWTRAAPPPTPSGVEAEIARMDDSLSAAFNAHDLRAVMALFTADLEFYHDTQGLQRQEAVRAGFANLFAARNRIRRERVGSIEVYPIREYGAIEVGRHRFCHDEARGADCGEFAFVHVWRRDDGAWRIARVVSYGH